MRFQKQLLAAGLGLLLTGLASTAFGQTPPGLDQPGTVQSGSAYEFEDSPSMAVFNNEMYIAYGSNDGNNDLRIIGSTDGVNWTTPPSWTAPQLEAGTSPAIVNWNGALWVAFVAAGSGGLQSDTLYIANSTNPLQGFSTPVMPTVHGAQTIANSSPSLTVFNNELWITWQFTLGDNQGSAVNTFSTSNGTTFAAENGCVVQTQDTEPAAGEPIAITSQGSEVWYGWSTVSGTLEVCSWAGGTATPAFFSVNELLSGGVSAISNGEAVFFAYSDFNTNFLKITATETGATFNTETYTSTLVNSAASVAPSAAIFKGIYYLAYTQDNSGHHMFLESN